MKLTILQGDCIQILPRLRTTGINLVLTDLPYGTTQNKWDTKIDLSKMWRQLNRVCRSNAAKVFTCSQPFTTTLGQSNIAELKYSWVWEKSAATGHLNAKHMPMKSHEDVLVFYTGRVIYNPQGLTRNRKGSIRRGRGSSNFGSYGASNTQTHTNYPRSVIRIPSVGQTGKLHPTQKPIELMEYLIQTYTNPGDTVLDITAGSFTTAVAALRCGRSFVGIELDKEFVDAGKTRISKEFNVHFE